MGRGQPIKSLMLDFTFSFNTELLNLQFNAYIYSAQCLKKAFNKNFVGSRCLLNCLSILSREQRYNLCSLRDFQRALQIQREFQ